MLDRAYYRTKAAVRAWLSGAGRALPLGAYSLSRSCRLDVQLGRGRCAPGLMNPRQPGLSCALFLARQALTRSTLGISALHAAVCAQSSEQLADAFLHHMAERKKVTP